MSMRRNTNNPLLDPLARPAGAADSTLPPPPPYSLQAGQGGQQPLPAPQAQPPRGPTAPAAYPPIGSQQAYPPVGSQQGYPPPSSQYAPPAGPPPGAAPGAATGAPAGAQPPPSTGNVRQNSGMGSVEALAKRMSMLTQSSPSRSSSGHDHTNPFSDAAMVSSPTTMHNPRFSSQNPFAPARQGSIGRTSARAEEDPLTLLKSFDSVFIVDDSSSMNVNELPGGGIGPSRWEEARDALSGVVELARHYDEDGVDIFFLNSDASLQGTKDPAAVRALFDSVYPEGPTPTGERLEMLMLEYWEKLDSYADRKRKGTLAAGEGPPKKVNYIVITDGRPTDEPADVIVACARRLDEGRWPLSQIGIQFLQVGNDAEATRALVELDDELSKVHKIRDMVDTTSYAGMKLSTDAITKALLGGINRRLDRQT
ncbi:hypothetical protein OC834_004268 [Tilletia horrida]|nr:hypothetical protein OC834_004268 [Tilletia horrida]